MPIFKRNSLDKNSAGRLVVSVASLLVAAGILWQSFHVRSALPKSYLIRHWNLAWSIYDLPYVVLYLLMGWLFWRRNHYFPLVAIFTAAWQLADGMFYILTAHGPDLARAVINLVPECGGAIILFALATWSQKHFINYQISQRRS